MKRALLMVLLVLAALCSLFSCGRRREREEKVLNLSLDSEIATLDPQAAVDSASLEVIGSCMEGLYAINEKGEAVLAGAEREEISADGLIRRYYLKERVWSDGSPVRAEDYVYGFQRAADPALANENAFLLETAGIKNGAAVYKGQMPLESLGIRAIDSRTLEISLDRPVTFFSSLMAFPLFFPAKEEFIKTCGSKYASAPEYLLSNGPYMMEKYQPSAMSFSLKKNPFYRGDSGNAEKIHYQVIKDSQQSLLAYQDGILDVAPLNGEQADGLQGSPEYHSFLLASLWYVSPNQKTKGLENEKLRKALTLSFDRQAITKYIMRDGSQPAGYAVPEGLGKGPDGKDFREGGLLWTGWDRELAREYWQEARKELGLKETDQLSYGLLAEDTETASLIAQFLQKQIEENLPGIKIEIERVPKKVRLARMKEGDYDLGLVRWGADYSDPTAFLEMWTTDSPYNYGSWSDKAYDEMIEYAVSGFQRGEEENRWKIMKEAEALVMEKAVVFPLCQKANAYMVREKVSGMEFHPTGINRIFKNVVIEEESG